MLAISCIEVSASTLKAQCELLKNINSKRTQVLIETLKLSASVNGCYSLAANQIKLMFRMFAMHREVKDGLWLYPAFGKTLFISC
jgi:peptide deformylase